MEQKYIELSITKRTLEVTELFKGYRSLHIETSRGNLWFFKDGLRDDDAEHIEVEKTYRLHRIVEIRNMGGGKSIPTLRGILLP